MHAQHKSWPGEVRLIKPHSFPEQSHEGTLFCAGGFYQLYQIICTWMHCSVSKIAENSPVSQLLDANLCFSLCFSPFWANEPVRKHLHELVHREQRGPNFTCRCFKPKGEVSNFTAFLQRRKTQLESGENSNSQGVSCSLQHFKSQKTSMGLRRAVNEMSSILIEMDFSPLCTFPRSAVNLFFMVTFILTKTSVLQVQQKGHRRKHRALSWLKHRWFLETACTKANQSFVCGSLEMS